MVTYRLIGSDFDVQIDTDAAVTSINAAREFFITDIRGLSAEEIRSGFDIEIMQHNEGELIDYARDNSLALYSYDQERGERCLVVPGVAAGRFSPGSSLVFPNVTRTYTTRTPFELSFIFRKTSAEWASVETVEQRLFRIEDDLFLGVTLGRPNILNFNFFSALPIRYVFPDPLPECQCISVRVAQESDTSNIEMYIDDEMVFTAPPVIFFNRLSRDIIVGSTSSNSFTGIMRNIRLIIGGETLLDVPDPSSGVNAGTAGPGTVNNIESISVII